MVEQNTDIVKVPGSSPGGSTMNNYNQDCTFGFMTIYHEDDLFQDKGSKIVECHNPKCPEKYCKFSFFTGGQIPDSECEYYSNFRRNT